MTYFIQVDVVPWVIYIVSYWWNIFTSLISNLTLAYADIPVMLIFRSFFDWSTYL